MTPTLDSLLSPARRLARQHECLVTIAIAPDGTAYLDAVLGPDAEPIATMEVPEGTTVDAALEELARQLEARC